MTQKEYYEIGDRVAIIESGEYGRIVDILETNEIVVDTTRLLRDAGGLRVVEASAIEFYKPLNEQALESVEEFKMQIARMTGQIVEEENDEVIEESEEEIEEEFDYAAYIESFGDDVTVEMVVADLIKNTALSIVEARELAADLIEAKKADDEESDDKEEPKKGKKANPFAKKDDSDDEESDDDEDDEDSDEDLKGQSGDHQDFTKGDKKSK